MLHLTYSNRLDVLVAPLAARIEAAQDADPLTPIELVVPNRAVEQFVRFRIAEQLGVAANLRFSLLRGFLAQRCMAADPRVRILDREALHLLLFKRLRDPAFVAEERLDAVQSYLEVAHDEVEHDLRALQLGGEVARLFEEYSFSRRPMLRRWRDGPALASTDYARAEHWQRRLWWALFDERARARVAPVAPADPGLADPGQMSLFAAPPRATRWMMLIDAVFSLQHRLSLPGQLHVFGLSYVAPAFAEVFGLLAERTDLCVYAINPCLEFWEDIDATGLRTLAAESGRGGWARRGERLTDAESDAESDTDSADAARQTALDAPDPFGLDRSGDTPALRLWGRPGRAFIRLLNELAKCEFAAGFVDPAPGPERTLLQRVQRDILVRAPERERSSDGAADESLRFIAAPNLRREVEICADLIWQLVNRDAQTGDPAAPLRFHQIAVMVTDKDREAYLTHIESIFRERHRLPFNIIDRSLAGQSRVVEAIERLLDLPLGEFGFDEVMGVLTHPAIGGAVAEDVQRWRGWCERLGIVFGADRTDLAETYIEEDVYNWDQALRRLVLGAFCTGERSGDDRIFEAAGGSWLPLETPADGLGDVARLTALVRRLVADARASAHAEMSLTDWAIYLHRLVTTYVHADGVGDEVALGACLRAFETLRAADLEGQVVGFAVAREMARLQLRALEGWRGQHQADGVVVSSLLPMRAIPFEVVVVLGLGEGQFPAPERQNPLDLRRARRRAGDVSPPERDRYLFLETLLAARQHLFLSYVARDGATGEPLEPSPVVRELQYILRGYVGPAALGAMTKHYPLADYDPSAAALDSDITSEPLAPIGIEARRAARIRELRAHLQQHTGGTLPGLSALRASLDPQTDHALSQVLAVADGAEDDAEDALRLPLYAVQRFLESPLQAWARFVLGLAENPTPDFEEAPDEPLAMDRRARSDLLQTAFWRGAGDADAVAAAYAEGFHRRALAGQAPVGLFADVRRARDLEVLETWRANLEPLELPPLQTWRVVRLGRGGEFVDIDDALPPIRLDVPLAGGRRRAVELHGTLPHLAPDRRTTLRCLEAAMPDEKHFLPGFLGAVALAAVGMPPGEIVRVVVTGRARAPAPRLERFYFVPPTRVALEWLTTVVAELLDARHDYRLPIEAVMRWRDDRSRNPEARLWWPPRDRTADRFGPVRDPDSLPVPDDREASAMVDRRFGLWFYAGRGARRRARS